MASFIRSCFLINKSYPQTNKSTPWSLIYLFLVGCLLFFMTTTLLAENHQDNAKVLIQDGVPGEKMASAQKAYPKQESSKQESKENKAPAWKKFLNIGIFLVVLITVIVLLSYKQKKTPKT